jgi:hypothetical protein
MDGGLQIDDGAEYTARQAPLGELGEEALHRVEPGTGSGREVEGEALVAGEPGARLGMLVGGVIVEIDMDRLASRDFRLDGVEEADKLLMAVSLHATPDDLAFEHIESGEQSGGTMALVVMGPGAGAPLLHRQARLGAVERLDLALLIDRQHDGMGRRIDVEPDHIAQLVDEFGVGAELELLNAMGLKPMGTPDAMHRADADAGLLSHHGSGPVRGLGKADRSRSAPPHARPPRGSRAVRARAASCRATARRCLPA